MKRRVLSDLVNWKSQRDELKAKQRQHEDDHLRQKRLLLRDSNSGASSQG